MPELSNEQILWMRNRFVEVLTRTEVLSEELILIRHELTQVIDALARLLPQGPEAGAPADPAE
jgi:hypothetical protein